MLCVLFICLHISIYERHRHNKYWHRDTHAIHFSLADVQQLMHHQQQQNKTMRNCAFYVCVFKLASQVFGTPISVLKSYINTLSINGSAMSNVKKSTRSVQSDEKGNWKKNIYKLQGLNFIAVATSRHFMIVLQLKCESLSLVFICFLLFGVITERS